MGTLLPVDALNQDVQKQTVARDYRVRLQSVN